MKKFYLLFLVAGLYSLATYAQNNDPCDGAFRLCPGFNLPIGKTTNGKSSEGLMTCGTGEKYSVWFFVEGYKTDSSATITINGINNICSPFGSGIGATAQIFGSSTGDCGGLTALDTLEAAKQCDSALAIAAGGPGTMTFTIDSTTAGKKYYIVINTPDTCTSGESFQITVTNNNKDALIAAPEGSFIDSVYYADVLVNARGEVFNTNPYINEVKADNFPISTCDTLFLITKNTSKEHGGDVLYYWDLDGGFDSCSDTTGWTWSGCTPVNDPSVSTIELDTSDTTGFLHAMFFPPCKTSTISLRACNECFTDPSFTPANYCIDQANVYQKNVNDVRVEPSVSSFPDPLCLGDCKTPMGFDLTATPNPPNLVEHYFNKFILTVWQRVCDTSTRTMVYDTTVFIIVKDTTIRPDDQDFTYTLPFPDTLNRTPGWQTGNAYDTIYTMDGKLLQNDTIIVDTIVGYSILGTNNGTIPDIAFGVDANGDSMYYFIPLADTIYTFLELFGEDTFCVSRKLRCPDTIRTPFILDPPISTTIISNDTLQFCMDDDSIEVCIRVNTSAGQLTATPPIRYTWYVDSVDASTEIRDTVRNPVNLTIPDTDCVMKDEILGVADFYGNINYVFHKKWFDNLGVFNRGDYQRLYPLIIEITDANGCCARDTAWVRICKPVIDTLMITNFFGPATGDTSTLSCALDDNGDPDNEKTCPPPDPDPTPALSGGNWYFIPTQPNPAGRAFCPGDSIDLGFTVRAYPGIRLEYYRVPGYPVDTLVPLTEGVEIFSKPYVGAGPNFGWDSVPPNLLPTITVDNPYCTGPATFTVTQHPQSNDSITVPGRDTIVRTDNSKLNDTAVVVYIKTPRNALNGVYGDTTDFIFALVAVDSFGCKDTAYLCVPIHEPPYVTIDSLCFGCPPPDSLFHVHGACEGSSYDWWGVDTTANPDTLFRDSLIKVLATDSSYATFMYDQLTDAQLIGREFTFAVIVGDSGTLCRDTVIFKFKIDSLFRAEVPDTVQACVDDSVIEICAKVDEYNGGPLLGQLTGQGPFKYTWYVDSTVISQQFDYDSTSVDSSCTVKDSILLIYDLYAFHKKYLPNPPATYMDVLNIIVKVEDSKGCVCIDTTKLILCKPSIDTMRITNLGTQGSLSCATDEFGFPDNEIFLGCTDPWYCQFTTCGSGARAFCKDDSINLFFTVRGKPGLKFDWYRVVDVVTDSLTPLVPDTEIFARPYSGATPELGWDTITPSFGDSIHVPNSPVNDTIVYLRPKQSNVLAGIVGDTTDYMIALVVTDSMGCKDTAYLCVPIHEPPYVMVDTLCLTDSIVPDSMFRVRGSCAGSTYEWWGVDTTVTPWALVADTLIKPGDSSYASFNFKVFPDSVKRDSIFTFAVVVRDGVTGCMDTVLFKYNIGDILQVDIDTVVPDSRVTDTVICLGESVTIYLDTAKSDIAGVTFVWLSWPQDSTNADTIAVTTDDTIVVSPTDTTKFIVIANRGTCQAIDSITIYVDSVPYATVAALPDDTVCECNDVILTVSSINVDTSNFRYKWTHLRTDSNSITNDSVLTTIAKVCVSDTFILTITDTVTGCSNSVVGGDSIFITAVPYPVTVESDSIAKVINPIREALDPAVLPFRVDSICARSIWDSADVILSTLGSDSVLGTKYIWTVNYSVGNAGTSWDSAYLRPGMHFLKIDSISSSPVPESFKTDTFRINKYTELCLTIISVLGCDTTICDTIFEYDPICIAKTHTVDTLCDISGLCQDDFSGPKDTMELCVKSVIDTSRSSFAWTFEAAMSSDTGVAIVTDTALQCVSIEVDSSVMFSDNEPDTLVFRAVVIDSIKGCMDTLYHMVIVVDSPTLSIASRPNDTVCEGDTIYYKAAGYVTYAWYSVPPDGSTVGDTIIYQSVSQDSIMAVPVTIGGVDTNYVYTVIGIAGACIDTLSDTVRVLVSPTVDIGLAGIQDICQSDSILIQPVAGANSDSVLWTVQGVSVAKGGFRFNYIRTNPLANDSTWYIPADTFGRDTLILAVYKNNPICSEPFLDTVIIDIDTLPFADIQMPDTIFVCQHDSPIINYSYRGGEVTWFLSANALTTTLDSSVNIDVTSDSIKVNIDTLFSGTMRIILRVSDAWDPPACAVAPDTMWIKVFKNGLAAIDTNLINICQGDATDTLADLVNLVADSVKWTVNRPSDGTFMPSDTSRRAIFVPDADTFGVFIIGLQAFTDSCAMDSATIVVNVDTLPVALFTLNNDTICEGDSTIINFSTRGGIDSMWVSPSASGTLVKINATSAKFVAAPGVVNCPVDIMLRVRDANAPFCADSTDTLKLCILAAPTVTLVVPASDTICEIDTISISVNAANYTDTLVWKSKGLGMLIKNTNLSYTYISVSQGIDTVWVIANNTACGGVSDTAIMRIRIDSVPDVNLVASSSGFCGGDTLILTDSLKRSTLYDWWVRNDSTGVLTHIMGPTPVDTLLQYPDTSSTYFMYGYTTLGCYSVDSISISVTPNDLPPFDAGEKDGECYPLSAEFTYLGGISGLDSLKWVFGDGDSLVVTSGFTVPFKHQFPVGDTVTGTRITYYVTLTAYYSNGCSRDSIFKRESCVDFYIPNVFTPDGDGSNDRFVIRGIVDKNCDLQIFNRWGEKIFEGKYPVSPEPGWDGRDKDNNLVNTDTYYFLLKCGDGTTYTGWVKVIRQQ